MKICKWRNVVVLCVCMCTALSFSSCKKLFGKVAKEFAEETMEESTEAFAKKGGRKTLREMSEKAVKNLSDKDFATFLKRDFPYLDNSLSRLDNAMQKNILKEMKQRPDLLEKMISNKTLVDAYIIKVRDVPDLAGNFNFFRFFVEHNGKLENIVIKQGEGFVGFYRTGSNDLMARYKDGVMYINDAFDKYNPRLLNNELLNKELMPNTLYRIKGKMGLSYTRQTDNLGRVVFVQAERINPDELTTNIIRRDNDVNLGQEWVAQFKKIKQASRGDDVSAKVRFKYDGDSHSPSVVDVQLNAVSTKVDGKFVNTTLKVAKKYTPKQNEKLLKKFAGIYNLSEKKRQSLLDDMNTNPELADLIQKDHKNIGRWLSTRNPVNEKLVARTANGRMVPNGRVYAGNTYFFAPALNQGLNARLRRKNGLAALKKAGIKSREDLIALHKEFPEGIPFNKRGFPDFTIASYKVNGKPTIMNIGKAGTREEDIAKANLMFRQQYGKDVPTGYTWHHMEDGRLMLVRSDVHQLVDHGGSVAMKGVP